MNEFIAFFGLKINTAALFVKYLANEMYYKFKVF